jgi:hypothetical protein
MQFQKLLVLWVISMVPQIGVDLLEPASVWPVQSLYYQARSDGAGIYDEVLIGYVGSVGRDKISRMESRLQSQLPSQLRLPL